MHTVFMFVTCFNIQALLWPSTLFFFIFWLLILKRLCIPGLNYHRYSSTISFVDNGVLLSTGEGSIAPKYTKTTYYLTAVIMFGNMFGQK